MTDKQKDGALTPVQAGALIPRLDGLGFYVEGDRVVARDVVDGNAEKEGVIGVISSDGKGKDYMVIQHGEEPFLDAFLCTRGDIIADLPDPEDAEQLEAWLESGA